MTVDSIRRRVSDRVQKLPRHAARACARGQSMVEFALIASVALIVLLVGIQFAIIGQAALAVSQAAYIGARYAAVHNTASDPSTGSALQTAILPQLSPTISESAGAHLTTTLVCKNSAGTTIACAGRPFGSQVFVTMSYNATSKIVLGPASGWHIGSWTIHFPTTLASTQSMMTE